MLERDFQRKLLKALKEHQALKSAVIFKHNDYYTAGIPDISITLDGNTTWFELKVFPNTPTKLQAHYLKKLQPRSYVVTAENDVVLVGDTICLRTVGTFNSTAIESAVDCIVSICTSGETFAGKIA